MVLHHPYKEVLAKSLRVVGRQAECLIVCTSKSTENSFDPEAPIDFVKAVAEWGLESR